MDLLLVGIIFGIGIGSVWRRAMHRDVPPTPTADPARPRLGPGERSLTAEDLAAISFDDFVRDERPRLRLGRRAPTAEDLIIAEFASDGLRDGNNGQSR